MMNVWFNMLQPLGNVGDSMVRSKQSYDVTSDDIWPDVRFKDYRPSEFPSTLGWVGTSQPILKRSILNYQGCFTTEGRLIEQAIQLNPVLHARLAERYASVNAALNCRSDKSDEQSSPALHSCYVRSSTPCEEVIGAFTASNAVRQESLIAEETHQNGNNLQSSAENSENDSKFSGGKESQDPVGTAVQTNSRVSWSPISGEESLQPTNQDRLCFSASLSDGTVVYIAQWPSSVFDITYEATFTIRLPIVHQFWEALLEGDLQWQAIQQAQKVNQTLIGIRILK